MDRVYKRYKRYTNIIMLLKGNVDILKELFTTTVLNILLLFNVLLTVHHAMNLGNCPT